MNKRISVVFLSVLVIIISSVIITSLTTNDAESLDIEINQKETKTDLIILNQNFTVNLNGKYDKGDTLTIYGAVPNSNSSITGMIYHGDETNPTIVTIFQLTSNDNGEYTHDVKINDDYLWKKDVSYIISVQNNKEYKEINFHRSLI